MIVFFMYVCLILSIKNATCSPERAFEFRAFPAELRMNQGVPYPLEVNVIQCCLVCAQNNSCTSVNYNKISKICEINSLKMKSREYRIQADVGWKLYEKLPCGLGYKSGGRCRHIQNKFQYDAIVTHDEASGFCQLLGENLVTLENEQDKSDLESDLVSADAYVNAHIWLAASTDSGCLCFRRSTADVEPKDCDLNASVVCE